MRSNSISCSQLRKNQKLPWSPLIKMSLAKEHVGRKDSIHCCYVISRSNPSTPTGICAFWYQHTYLPKGEIEEIYSFLTFGFQNTTRRFFFLHILTILWPVSLSHLNFQRGPLLYTLEFAWAVIITPIAKTWSNNTCCVHDFYHITR